MSDTNADATDALLARDTAADADDPTPTQAADVLARVVEGDVLRVPQYQNALTVTSINRAVGMVGVEFVTNKTSATKHLIVNENSGRVALVAGTTDKGRVDHIDVVTAVNTDDDTDTDNTDDEDDGDGDTADTTDDTTDHTADTDTTTSQTESQDGGGSNTNHTTDTTDTTDAVRDVVGAAAPGDRLELTADAGDMADAPLTGTYTVSKVVTEAVYRLVYLAAPALPDRNVTVKHHRLDAARGPVLRVERRGFDGREHPISAARVVASDGDDRESG